MVKCCIRGCSSNSRRNSEGLSFFRFPKNKALQELWLHNIGIGNIEPLQIITICSKHFEENCINRTMEVIRLKDGVAPTLFPFSSSSVQPKVALSMKTNNIGNGTALLKETNSSSVQSRVALSMKTNNTGNGTALLKEADVVLINPIDPLKIEPTSMDGDLSVNTGGDPMVDMVIINPIDPIKMEPTSMDADLSVNTGGHPMGLPSKTVLKELKVASRLQKQRKKIKMLNQKCRRLQTRVLKFQNVIDELKKQNLIPNSLLSLL